YTVPSTPLTAREKTCSSARPGSLQVAPPSVVLRTPPGTWPTYTVSGSVGSSARHCAPLSGSACVTSKPSAPSSRRTNDVPVVPYRRARDELTVPSCLRERGLRRRRRHGRVRRRAAPRKRLFHHDADGSRELGGHRGIAI